jgi:hypothetical protein
MLDDHIYIEEFLVPCKMRNTTNIGPFIILEDSCPDFNIINENTESLIIPAINFVTFELDSEESVRWKVFMI